MSKLFKGTRYKYGVEIGDPSAKTGIASISAAKAYTATLTPSSVAANTTAEQTFTVTGLEAGDVVLAVNKPTAQAGLGIVNYRVSAANTLAITFSNNTGSAIVPTAETYLIMAATLQ